jgi:hypothetical protein
MSSFSFLPGLLFVCYFVRPLEVDDELGKIFGGIGRVLMEVLYGICLKRLNKITKPVCFLVSLFNDIFSAAQFV